MNNISYLGFLSLLFIGLKLGGAITWSWWLVLLPLYAPVAIFLVVIMITAPVMAFLAISNNKNRKGEMK